MQLVLEALLCDGDKGLATGTVSRLRQIWELGERDI